MSVCELSTKEIVQAVVKIGEKVSDMTLHPYQIPFAERIVEDLLEGGASSVTALFSRQCMDPSSEVLVPGGWKTLSELRAGDKIIALNDEGLLVEDKILDIWKVKGAKGHLLKTSTTRDTLVSSLHRFYSARRKSWATAERGIAQGSALEGVCLLIQNSKIENGIPTNTPSNRESGEFEARLAAALLWGRDYSERSPILEKSIQTLCKSESEAFRFAKIFGLRPDFENFGTSYSMNLGNLPSREELSGVFENRKDIMKAILSGVRVEIKPYKNREYRAYLTIPVDSTGVYRRFLINFLEIHGIRVESSEKTKIEIHSPDCVRNLTPLLDWHPKYNELLHLFSAKTLITTPHIDIDELDSALSKDPKIWNMLRNMRSSATLKRWQKTGLAPKTTIMKAISTLCPEKLHEYIPIRDFKNVSDIFPKPPTSQQREEGYDFIDMETELTSTYIANHMTSHNSGKSEAIAVVIIGCILWLPTLAMTYRTDKRFRKFAKGCWVGVFAPIIMQSKNIYNRVRRRLNSAVGRELMDELNIEFETNQAQAFELTNGSKLFASPAGDDANIESQTFHLVIGDESQDISGYKWNKSIVPMTTMTAGTKVLVGTANTLKSHFYLLIKQNKIDRPQDHFEVDYTVPSKYIPEYKQSVEKAMIEMGFDSDEFKMAYRNIFIFARGMFVEPEVLEFKTNENPKGIIRRDYDMFFADEEYTGVMPVTMGIDIGKKNDSTVCTPLGIDIFNPIETLGFQTYNKFIMGWLEMLGDDIDTQLPRMIDYIRRMNARSVAVDSTGKGEIYYEKLSKALPDRNIIPVVFSRPSKSAIFKGLQSTLNTNSLNCPGGDLTRRAPEFVKFVRQMGDLQKEYYGQYLDVRAPNGRNFHDDYGTSLALADYASRGMTMGTVKISENPFFKRKRRGF